jgi:cyanophycin synthetase
MLYRKRLQAVLFHRISMCLKARKRGTPRSYKYESFNISKYIETAEKLNIEVTPVGFGCYEFKKGNINRRIMNGLTDRESALAYKLCGNKYLTYKILLNNGIKNIPKHQLYTFRDIDKTYNDFRDWGCRVVIKPCSATSCGEGVTVDIKTIKELKNAIAQSFVFDRKYYLMEQFVEGSHFRVLTLNGNFIACSQRTSARIIGNGKDSIKKLILKENKKRSENTNEKALCSILFDNELTRKLKRLNKTIHSVLKNGEEIYVKDVVNLHTGGEVLKIENVSEGIKKVCKRIANFLNIYLAGFDIITSDINKSLDETGGVINEVNTTPGLDVIYKVTNCDADIDIAEIILRDMFNISEHQRL